MVGATLCELQKSMSITLDTWAAQMPPLLTVMPPCQGQACTLSWTLELHLLPDLQNQNSTSAMLGHPSPQTVTTCPKANDQE